MIGHAGVQPYLLIGYMAIMAVRAVGRCIFTFLRTTCFRSSGAVTSQWSHEGVHDRFRSKVGENDVVSRGYHIFFFVDFRGHTPPPTFVVVKKGVILTPPTPRCH